MVFLSFVYRFLTNFLFMAMVYFSLNYMEKYEHRAGLAILVLLLGRALVGAAVAAGIAGGLFFAIGDISTKLVTEGGVRTGFLLTLVLGYLLGTVLLQVGYQAGGALTVAGVATLLTNALPIAAGTVVLDEPVPSGVYGGLRILAFAAVTAGGVLLATPQDHAAT